MSRSRVRAELRRVSARALAAATITLGGCASGPLDRLAEPGALASGAGRLVVLLDDRGHVTASDAKLAPGSEAARAALLCLIGPARGLSYPPVAPGKSTPRRGFAVEAVWEGPGK